MRTLILGYIIQKHVVEPVMFVLESIYRDSCMTFDR